MQLDKFVEGSCFIQDILEMKDEPVFLFYTEV